MNITNLKSLPAVSVGMPIVVVDVVNDTKLDADSEVATDDDRVTELLLIICYYIQNYYQVHLWSFPQKLMKIK